MIDPRVKVERIEKQIDELTHQIEILSKERDLLIMQIEAKEVMDGEKEQMFASKCVKLIKRLPIQVQGIFKKVGITNDILLKRFLEGNFEMDEVKKKQLLYFNSYKIAKTREARLLAIHGIGPVFLQDIMEIVEEK